MKIWGGVFSESTNSEISTLVNRLHETEQRLQDLTDGNVDAVLYPGGRCYLLPEAREKLRLSDERFRKVFDAAAVGIAVMTAHGHILQANALYWRMLGYTKDDLRAHNFAKPTHPGDLNPKVRNELLTQQRDSFVTERRRVTNKGDIQWIRESVSAAPAAAGEIATLIVIAEDVTERKVAEQRLSRLNRLHAVLSKVGEAIVRTRGRQELFNDVCRIVVEDGLLRMVFIAEVDAAAKMAKPVAACGMGVEYLLEPTSTIPMDGGPLTLGTVGTALRTGTHDVCNDIAAASRMIPWREAALKSGLVANASFPINLHGTTVGVLVLYAGEVDYFLDDEIGLMVTVAKNLSFAVEALEKEQERQKTEARFRRLMDSNAQGVAFWNTKGEFYAANDAFLKLVHHTREDLENRRINWVAMTPPEYAETDRQALNELAATGICASYEKEFVRKDGSRVAILIGAAMFEDSEGEGVCFVHDLTERKKLEHQFRQAQKMEVIGTLAAGVAHDFNNLLAIIQLGADALNDEGGLSAVQSKSTEDIIGTVQRASALTRQLLLFSSSELFEPHDLDLCESITNTAHMLKRIVGEHIEMQLTTASKPIFLHADSGMMDQVLLNLVVNARDAMPNGGQLTIEIFGVDFDKLSASRTAQARVGSFVCLSVADTGCGIPPKTLPRIFEPFFTTKDVGKGTGLGLATVFGIVRQHQGWVNVRSEVGRGTTFQIYLPRLIKRAEPKTSPPAQNDMHGGSETILLVEDDPKLRAAIQSVLTRLGYRIIEALNGIKALEAWKEHRHEIRLLLTDMLLPDGMSGKDLATRILLEAPEMKVIYMSGYSGETTGGDVSMCEGVNFLTKPIKTPKLARTVRNRLDSEPTRANI
jgi:PAS domain S-box-containing protein